MAGDNTHEPTIIETNIGKDFADTAAHLLYSQLKNKKKPLVVLPTGKTPEGMYQSLVTHYGDDNSLWQTVRYLSLDEYAGLDSKDDRLFHRWVGQSLLDKVNIPLKHRHVFNSLATTPEKESARIEKWISENGPIDIAVLGLGQNGHIGFNEPGSSFDSQTRIINLTPETIQANASYWEETQKTPQSAYTLGLKTIMDAKKIILLVSGVHKAKTLEKALKGPLTTSLPASILRKHPNVTIIADRPAMNKAP